MTTWLNILTVASLLMLAAGVATWLLIRKQQKKIWLPIVQIIKKESRKLPRLKLARPPWLPFLCFMISGLVFAALSFFPTLSRMDESSQGQLNHHIFVDLSPSVSAQASISDIVSQVKDFVGTLGESTHVTFSTSHSQEIFPFKDLKFFTDKLQSLGFHRAGVRLGQALQQQMESLKSSDHLVVISDNDAHSWGDFYWGILSEDLDVSWLPPRSLDRPINNVFIDEVVEDSQVDKRSSWRVSLRRTRAMDEQSGRLVVMRGEKRMQTEAWTFLANDRQLDIQVNWGTDLIVDRASASQLPLTFRLDGIEDDLTLDNEFRVSDSTRRTSGVLVAQPTGESVLDDGAHHLSSILSVLGVNVDRRDFLEQPGPHMRDYPFWVILINNEEDVASSCPASIENARLASMNQSKKQLREKTIVWMMPASPNADYKSLCHCYARLMTSTASGEKPLYCSEVQNRRSYLEMLASVGAVQIGGDIDRADGAIAFRQQHKPSQLSVTAFTLPLIPSRLTGLTYGRLPLMVRNLLQVEQMIDRGHRTSSASWLRVEDLAAWGGVRANTNSKGFSIGLSNVPFSESIDERVDDTVMPKRWAAVDSAQTRFRKEEETKDPLPWIRLGAMVLLLSMVLELIGYGVIRMKQQAKAVLILMLLFVAFDHETVFAQTNIAIHGGNYKHVNPQLERLAKEVSSRTSMELDTRLQNHNQIGASALRDGWLWVDSMSRIAGNRGQIKGSVSRWVRRGGLLILENVSDEKQLNKLVQDLRSANPNSRWQAIPPDHEMMRSFYLLDSLPDCNGQVWKGFHQDGRLMIIGIPGPFLPQLMDGKLETGCYANLDWERKTRLFINLLMVSMTTDYKKDQIHLPEILKRLR